MDIQYFIVEDKIGNANSTRDKVFIPSKNTFKATIDTKTGHVYYPLVVPTDYARLNNAYCAYDMIQFTGGDPTTMYWLRDYENGKATAMTHYGDIANGPPIRQNLCVCPIIRLDINKILQSQEALNFFKINQSLDKSGKTKYSMFIGEFPQTYVGNRQNEHMEKVLSISSATNKNTSSTLGIINPSGKKYFGHYNSNNNTTINNGRPLVKLYEECEEYVYRNEKYARVKAKVNDTDSKLSNGILPRLGEFYWCKVEPLEWRILNFAELPKPFNPNGTGKAKYIKLRCEQAVLGGMPFYPFIDDEYNFYWQNSTIRGYLNGINVNDLDFRGSKYFEGYPSAPNGGDFSGSGKSFLSQAFEESQLNQSMNEDLNESNNTVQKYKTIRKNPYGVRVAKGRINKSEQIKFYVEKGKSFMLHGPSGVGKTRRIEEVDPNFVAIVLRNGMLPEEVIGKTIYPNGDTSKPSLWMPPAWYIDLCEKCEREKDRNHILFIDEITNVKPAEQSLVYNLVLTRSIGPNLGKLPKNVVVVAAGNSKKESEAAYTMPEPLFRRFEGHVNLEPNLRDWLLWGAEKSHKGENRTKIHPLVANFVAAYESVFYTDYDSEEPPEYAIDPRGWEQISDLIYDNDGEIIPELIENKVGQEIAKSFVAFAEQDLISVEDVVGDDYAFIHIPKDFDQQFVIALILKSANEEQISKVYNFVKDNFYAEVCAIFKKLWVGDSVERAILMESISQELDNKEYMDRVNSIQTELNI